MIKAKPEADQSMALTPTWSCSEAHSIEKSHTQPCWRKASEQKLGEEPQAAQEPGRGQDLEEGL